MQFLGAKFRIQLGPTVRDVIAHEVKKVFLSSHSLFFVTLYLSILFVALLCRIIF